MGIEDLSQGTATSASQVPYHDTANGQDRRASLEQLADVILGILGLNSGGVAVTQYAAPNATGFNVAIVAPESGAVYLLLTPQAGYATGTITLPALADCYDGMELVVSCTQAVTTLTLAGNGSTVNGAPTTLAANAFFRLRFDAVFSAWFRAG